MKQCNRKSSPDRTGGVQNLVAAVSLLLKVAFNVVFWNATRSKRAPDAAFDR